MPFIEPWSMPSMPSDDACFIHVIGGSSDVLSSPHMSSQPWSIPAWVAWVLAMSNASRRTSSSSVRSRTMNDISTAC